MTTSLQTSFFGATTTCTLSDQRNLSELPLLLTEHELDRHKLYMGDMLSPGLGFCSCCERKIGTQKCTLDALRVRLPRA